MCMRMTCSNVYVVVCAIANVAVMCDVYTFVVVYNVWCMS